MYLAYFTLQVADKNYNVWFRKISILPPQKGLEFPEGWGFYETKNLKKYMKLNWNFQRGAEVLEKIPSVGEVGIFSGTQSCTVD